jgi:hypothetical protein
MRMVRLAGLICVVLATPAFGQSLRTWVSAASGVDNAQCSRSSPCRTFGAALTAVLAGGEVVVLDSGGYGPFSITKAVSVISPPSVHAAIAPTSGSAISVSTGASDRVSIRGLHLQSQGANIGIQISAVGTLTVQSNTIVNFTTGIYASVTAPANLTIEDTTTRNPGSGSGIYVEIFGAESDRISVSLNRVRTEQAGNGIYAGYRSRVSANDVVSVNNFSGLYCNYCNASIMRSVFSHNTTGVLTTCTTDSKVYIGYSAVTFNTTGFEQQCGSQLNTMGNNLVAGNNTDVTGTLTTLVGK